MKLKPVFEALKEPLRWFLLSIVAYAVSLLTQNIPGIADFLYEYLQLNIEITTMGLTVILRFLDKYLHEVGKIEDNESLIKGLTRF